MGASQGRCREPRPIGGQRPRGQSAASGQWEALPATGPPGPPAAVGLTPPAPGGRPRRGDRGAGAPEELAARPLVLQAAEPGRDGLELLSFPAGVGSGAPGEPGDPHAPKPRPHRGGGSAHLPGRAYLLRAELKVCRFGHRRRGVSGRGQAREEGSRFPVQDSVTLLPGNPRGQNPKQRKHHHMREAETER